MDRDTLLNQLALVDFVVTRNVDGISHEASLKQPSEGGNNVNWIMGHVVRSRSQAIQLLGVPSSIDQAKYEVYNDEPLADPSQAVRFEDIVASFKAMQPRFIEGLQNLSAEEAVKPAPFSPTGNAEETVGSLLVGFMFHETYHAGQTGVLRRIAGKQGVLKAPKAGSTA
jgi:uncharacterized damage-inducible protein DinB